MRLIVATYYCKPPSLPARRSFAPSMTMKVFQLRIPEVDTFRSMADAVGRARGDPLNFREALSA